MTRHSKRSVENRLGDLEATTDGGKPDNGERVFVARVGVERDEEKPTGWLSREEYREHFGSEPESEFNYNIQWGST